jgi:hypothetical protein
MMIPSLNLTAFLQGKSELYQNSLSFPMLRFDDQNESVDINRPQSTNQQLNSYEPLGINAAKFDTYIAKPFKNKRTNQNRVCFEFERRAFQPFGSCNLARALSALSLSLAFSRWLPHSLFTSLFALFSHLTRLQRFTHHIDALISYHHRFNRCRKNEFDFHQKQQ